MKQEVSGDTGPSVRGKRGRGRLGLMGFAVAFGGILLVVSLAVGVRHISRVGHDSALKSLAERAASVELPPNSQILSALTGVGNFSPTGSMCDYTVFLTIDTSASRDELIAWAAGLEVEGVAGDPIGAEVYFPPDTESDRPLQAIVEFSDLRHRAGLDSRCW